MSRNRDDSFPSPLRDRLREEPDDTRNALDALWRRLGDLDPTPGSPPDLDEEWAALQDRRPEIARDSEADTETSAANGRAHEHVPDRPSRRARRSAQWARSVAALAVVLVIVGGVLWIWRQPVTVTADAGEQRTTTLPDGSTVALNSGTTLRHPRGFQAWPFVPADRRAIELTGEAFFTVESGSRPFVVETPNATVTVEGTRFNVRARTALDSTTAVTVAEGTVRLSAHGRPNDAVTLDDAGETSRVRGTETLSLEQTDLNSVLAWRTNGFAASEEPLVHVLQELEQRYDTALHLHDSVPRPRASVSLYYPEPTRLPTILRDLCTALNLNYRPTRDGYEVFAEPSA